MYEVHYTHTVWILKKKIKRKIKTIRFSVISSSTFDVHTLLPQKPPKKAFAANLVKEVEIRSKGAATCKKAHHIRREKRGVQSKTRPTLAGRAMENQKTSAIAQDITRRRVRMWRIEPEAKGGRKRGLKGVERARERRDLFASARAFTVIRRDFWPTSTFVARHCAYGTLSHI